MAETKQWTLEEIIEDWLREHDYDGLCNVEIDDEGCGCGIDWLFPCDDPGWAARACEAAYKYEKGGFGPNKELRANKLNPDA